MCVSFISLFFSRINVDNDSIGIRKTREVKKKNPSSLSNVGLTPGDFWCLCATRWREALDAGVAPRVNVGATHRSALSFRGISRETLEANSATSANTAAASRGGAASGATCDADGGCGTRESLDR